ncbi:MAG TPA: cation:proton antiporter [Longimicrobiales bacterium]|nr:cation:proton antiporter [Longimicrobiales bacterium]
MTFDSPQVTVAIALAAGMLCQSLAHHLRMPGIVLLLLAGVLLGPQVAGVVQPDTLGPYLQMIVAAAVAVILFEGGLNLQVKRLRGEALAIRKLITIGALITAVLATLAAHYIIGWDWRIAVPFGTLVVVTGPTVVTPLLRRIRVNHKLHTVLEAEAVLIDPIGAVVAVVALEVVLSHELGEAAWGLLGIPTRILFGTVMGVVGGYAMAKLIAVERFIPEGLESVFTLAMLVLLFEVTDAVLPESGIMAAPIAGMVVGNMPSRPSRELREFKEQLTVMLVGLLFILLAAHVRLQEVTELGWRGVATVALLMFVIRPLTVAVSTMGSTLTMRERAFVAWLAPRGIVAAAVASLFAEQLTNEGLPEGVQLRALVFLVIAATVLIQGLSGGAIASWLGVRRLTNTGWVIAGANALARTLAQTLKKAGEDVIIVDTDPAEIGEAGRSGIQAIEGNILDEAVLQQADLESRRGAISLIPNEAVSLLIAQKARRDYRVANAIVIVGPGDDREPAERVNALGAHVLFGSGTDLVHWTGEITRGKVAVQAYRYTGEAELDVSQIADADSERLPLVVTQRGYASPVSNQTRARTGDTVFFLEGPDLPSPDNFERAADAAGERASGDAEEATAAESAIP